LNKKRLVEIIKDPRLATEMEIKEINDLSSDYSYSSFLKVLNARIDNLNDNKNKSNSITKAAIYIADRSVLKEFILHDKTVDLTKEVESPSETDKDVTFLEDKETVMIPAEDGNKVDELSEKEAGIVKEEKEQTIKEKIKDIIETTEDIKDEEKEEKLEETPEEREETGAEDVQLEKRDEESIDKKVEEEIAETAARKSDENKESASGEVSPPGIKEEPTKEELKPKKEPEEIKEDKVEVSSEQSIEVVTGEKDKIEDEKEEEASLSNEVMKNISELRKHKATLFNFLDSDGKSNRRTEKSEPGKSSKKSKLKKELEKNKDRNISKSEKKIHENSDIVSEPSRKDKDSDGYPDYEEEDPKVIKDFLNELEKEHPPPKRKLKKEEQEELIEKFIQSEPQLQNILSSQELPEKKDLSLPSVKFRDDIISENLACILIKQGKLEKAIDIYKKLIWKFPQKKAYFAAQIEKLKKKLNK
jgi:hypothetical protein